MKQQFYIVDVDIGNGVIDTACYLARGWDDAKAKAWDHGEPVCDPELLKVQRHVKYFKGYAVERTNGDIVHHPFRSIPL